MVGKLGVKVARVAYQGCSEMTRAEVFIDGGMSQV